MSVSVRTMGGGGAYAALIVQAPDGSTVTVSKGSKSYTKAVTAVGSICQADFKINEQGEWNITSTDGEHIASEKVLIDAADYFYVEIDYFPWLFKDGNPKTSLTGGWQLWSPTVGSYGHGSAELTDDSILFSSTGINQLDYAATMRKIDLSQYSRIYADVDVSSQMSAQHCSFYLQLTDELPNTSSVVDTEHEVGFKPLAVGKHTISMDISGYNGNYHFCICGYYLNGRVYRIWLE